MTLCDCCDRRTGLSLDPCGCDPCYCELCLLCSQHCRCTRPRDFLVDEEFEDQGDEPVVVESTTTG